MFFIKMFLIPLLILFTYMPYPFLKSRKSENETFFLRGFLLVYFLATICLLISVPYLVHQVDFTSEQYRLVPIIVTLWAIVAIGFFLCHLFQLYRYFSYTRQTGSVLSRHDIVLYLFQYGIVSFLLDVYWFHPAIWFWYRMVMRDLLPRSVRKEYYYY